MPAEIASAGMNDLETRPPRSERRRTKIVATVGSASRDPEVLRDLVSAGVDVFRLNFSHGTVAEHRETIGRVRVAAAEAGRYVGILGDLPGPKLRLDEVSPGGVMLHEGRDLILTTERLLGSEERLSFSHQQVPVAVRPNEMIFLADGRIRLRALDSSSTEIRCLVEVGGRVSSHQGVNIPALGLAEISAEDESDLRWVDFAVDKAVDILAVSFVSTARDLEPLHQRLEARQADIPLVVKIEKPQAVENASELIRASSGVMVARGDLGIELPLASVPLIQKQLIAEAGRRATPSITATQMLASMVSNNRPTRAEVADIANAIFDGTDALMLSEETAIGDYPVEAVRVMDEIARRTEAALPYRQWLETRVEDSDDVAGSVAHAAVATAYRAGLKAIVVPTTSGRTARLVSALRPEMPILAVSPRPETPGRLAPLFGITSIHRQGWPDLGELIAACAGLAREYGVAQSGDLIAIAAGLPEDSLGTNLLEIHRVP